MFCQVTILSLASTYLPRLLLSVGTTDNKLPMCGYQELVRGGSAEVQLSSWLGSHSLSYGCHWREVTGFSVNAPLSVRANAGHSLKSSVKVGLMHTFLHCYRAKVTFWVGDLSICRAIVYKCVYLGMKNCPL